MAKGKKSRQGRINRANRKRRNRQRKAARRFATQYIKVKSNHRIHGGVSNEQIRKVLSWLCKDFSETHKEFSDRAFLLTFYESYGQKDITPPEKGFVYIIGNREHGYCKIGRSKNPGKRLSGIQTGCPFDLSILALFENRGAEFEQRLHERAEPYHERGEWFRIEGRLKDYLDNETDENESHNNNL